MASPAHTVSVISSPFAPPAQRPLRGARPMGGTTQLAACCCRPGLLCAWYLHCPRAYTGAGSSFVKYKSKTKLAQRGRPRMSWSRLDVRRGNTPPRAPSSNCHWSPVSNSHVQHTGEEPNPMVPAISPRMCTSGRGPLVSLAAFRAALCSERCSSAAFNRV